MNRKQKIGLYGEQLAEKFFCKKGYKILDKRFQTRFGEIDLIISKDNEIAFVEVKTRTSNVYGSPEEAVGYYKIKKMQITANQYMREKNIINKNFRLDCLAIELDLNKKTAKIRHYENIGF